MADMAGLWLDSTLIWPDLTLIWPDLSLIPAIFGHIGVPYLPGYTPPTPLLPHPGMTVAPADACYTRLTERVSEVLIVDP